MKRKREQEGERERDGDGERETGKESERREKKMMMRCQVIDRPESILMTTSFADICRFFGYDDIGIAFAIQLRFVLLLSVSY